MERWREVADTGGKILVSDQGRVKSLLRDERILKTQTDKKGYSRIRITIDRQKRSYKVHRLVAQAFIPNPDGKAQVNHKDGDKSNNAVENLEWNSSKENCNHAIKSGLWDSVTEGARRENERRKKAVVATKISTQETIRFESVRAAEKYVGSRHVTDVLKGKRTKTKGYQFVYAEGGDAICHS